MTDLSEQEKLGQLTADQLAEWKTRWPARNQLRDYVAKWLGKTTANERSVATYSKRADEVRSGHVGLIDATKKSTWRMTKYSIIYRLSEQIEDALRNSAKADRENRYADASAMIAEALKFKARIDEIRTTQVPSGLASAKSKRAVVSKLPADFYDSYFRAALGTQLEDVLACMGVIGGRPSEYDPQHGVTVCRDGGNLKFRIAGSKVKGSTQGLAWREITVLPRSDCAQYLYEKCESGPFVVTVESSDWLTQHVRRHCKKLTGRDDITPYVWRNRFAVQVKSEWRQDKEAIAISMGHSSTDSQSRYGYYGGRSKKVFTDKIVAINGSKSRAEIRVKASKMTLFI
jgi:hypothetical protein